MSVFASIKEWFSKPEPMGAPALLTPLPSRDELLAMSVDELNALNQAMGREQDAIREQRKAVARVIDAKLTGV